MLGLKPRVYTSNRVMSDASQAADGCITMQGLRVPTADKARCCHYEQKLPTAPLARQAAHIPGHSALEEEHGPKEDACEGGDDARLVEGERDLVGSRVARARCIRKTSTLAVILPKFPRKVQNWTDPTAQRTTMREMTTTERLSSTRPWMRKKEPSSRPS